jgi:SAM-dependent methyltransferase
MNLSARIIEIERALRSYPGVQDVHVEEKRSGEGTALVAYVLRARADGRKSALQEDVWKTVFEETFQRDEADENLSSSVWGSSYTGEPIETNEIRDWVGAAVSRILALEPRRVLEIGCGDGQLLLKIAPHCERYAGTDLSKAAIAIVARRVSELGISGVDLSQRSGADFTGFDEGAFDAVVINSVAQYFPSFDYLLEVLENARRVLAPGGAIFLGDLRNLRWAKHFYLSVELHHASADLTPPQLREKMRKRIEAEKELLLDPSVAHHFMKRFDLAGARAELKTGRNENELVRFRYDLTLFTKGGQSRLVAAPSDAASWADVGSLAALRDRLAATTDSFLVHTIPNARLVGLSRALQKLRDADDATTSTELRQLASSNEGVAPADLFDLAKQTGFHLCLGPSSLVDCCDAFFAKSPEKAVDFGFGIGVDRAPRDCVTDPMNRGGARFGKKMSAELGQRDPDLARLASIVVVDRIPRLADGALDRDAWLAELL